MKRFIACAGLNGDGKALESLLEVITEKKPDGILFAGGIISPKADLPHRINFLASFAETAGKSGYFMAMIPGPNDTPLPDYFRLALNTEVVFPNIYSVHATTMMRGDVAICGLGGILTEYEDSISPVIKYSHVSAEYFLRNLWNVNKPFKILLLSEPPPGKLAGMEGSNSSKEIIKNYRPTVCIVGGKREYRGVEPDGSTIIVNPGMLTEGSAAWVDLMKDKVEMIDLRLAAMRR